MKITSTRMVYIQPVQFKTICFHHQSEYFIEFSVKYRNYHKKKYVSAYPSLVPWKLQNSFRQKKLIQPPYKNKVQTEKFLILFNEQIITLNGGANFLIETDRRLDINERIDAYATFKLKRQDSSKTKNQKIEKVGQQTLHLNLNVLNDYSQFSSYRHAAFTQDQYFSSLLFYIDFVHIGINVRLENSITLQELNSMDPNKAQDSLKRLAKSTNAVHCSTNLRKLFNFKNLRALYQFLIQSRLKQLKRILKVYQNSVLIRQKYIKNYKPEETENIKAFIFQKPESLLIIEDLEYMELSNLQNDSQFYSYYETDDINFIYSSMITECKLIASNIRKIWNEINQLKLQMLPEQFMNYALKFKIDRIRHLTKHYSIVDQSLDLNPVKMKERLKNHENQRKCAIQESKFYKTNELKPPMLTFHSQKSQNAISNTVQRNKIEILVILVHGYQGSQRDMVKIKSFISAFTSINFLSLQTLSRQENQDILTLGKKGAEEISKYLALRPLIQSINFIGFSLGGIIAKAILANLEAHKAKFNLFMTFSSPHLGVSEIQNCLVSIGVFFIKKVSRSKSIKQLCFQPLNKKQGSITLLNLSKINMLSWFNHVVLVGSNEDSYVPKYSALLAYNGHDNIINQIQKNTIKQIKSIDRITAWFQYEGGCFDKLTGKKEHLSFIDDQTFLEYIIINYLHFF